LSLDKAIDLFFSKKSKRNSTNKSTGFFPFDKEKIRLSIAQPSGTKAKMTVEIKEIIRSPNQRLFVVIPSVDISDVEEITCLPALTNLISEKKYKLEKSVDLESHCWYLSLTD
jgi:hypothetical protein